MVLVLRDSIKNRSVNNNNKVYQSLLVIVNKDSKADDSSASPPERKLLNLFTVVNLPYQLS